MILHVAENGDNMADGLDEKYPLADIQRAYDKLAELEKAGQFDGPSRIYVHGGNYFLKSPLHFNGQFPVEILPWKEERVNITGGLVLTGWKKVRLNGKQVLKTELPAETEDVRFLYIDGKLAMPARMPKSGYYRVDKRPDEIEGLWSGSRANSFPVKKGDFNPSWHDPENISIQMIHFWIEENLEFDSHDPTAGILKTRTKITFNPRNENTEYAFYNVKEALSEPGEYYYARKERAIYYLPEDFKKPFEAAVPVRGTLMRIDSGARWIKITGLSFRHGGAYLPVFGPNYDLRDDGFTPLRNHACKENWGRKELGICLQSPQGAVQLPGVLQFDHAENCEISGCEITASGWYGIGVGEACRALTFRGNRIHELGGGGIIVGGAGAESLAKEPGTDTSKIVICDNHIHDCGNRFLSAVGIMVTHAWGCLIEHNHIHDLYYSGISCGWEWGYAPSVTRENRIGRNLIHDLGKGVLSDMGGIYTLGIQPGTRIYENIVFNVKNRYYGGWGLYTDEGSSHIVIENNLAHHCSCEGFHQHYGRENILRNNIFAFNKECGIAISRDTLKNCTCPGMPHSKVVTLLNNVILTEGTPAIKVSDPALLTEKKIYSDGNIFFDLSGKQKCFALTMGQKQEFSFAQWRRKGLDIHSVCKDPGFRHAEKNDFRLKKDSILREYGFNEIDPALFWKEEK